MQQFFKADSRTRIAPPRHHHNNRRQLVAEIKARRQITNIERRHTHGIRERSEEPKRLQF